MPKPNKNGGGGGTSSSGGGGGGDGGGRWEARLKDIHTTRDSYKKLGNYGTPEEAAQAYDVAVVQRDGAEAGGLSLSQLTVSRCDPMHALILHPC